MKTALNVSAFILLVVVLIAGFASLIPQVESPAPEALEITGELSGAELAALGQSVFESADAGCVACHAIGHEGLRGPDLAGIGARAAETVPGQTAEEYIYESIVDPCAYIVEGFDCIMPPNLLPILGPAKVTALVAYLQSLGGEITVTLSEAEAAEEPVASVGVPGATAEEIILNLGCQACHTIAALDAEAVIGPDLSQVGARLTPDEIRQSILDPDAVIAEDCPMGPCQPGIMPATFGDRLSATQLETLVEFFSNMQE